jgi:hypothetical protein
MSAGDQLLTVEWNHRELAEAHARRSALTVGAFPLRSGLEVDLAIEPFSITGPDTRFVLGSADGPDRPLVFDPSKILLFRGNVVGHAASHVFLALTESSSTGFVELGPGERRYRISSAGIEGDPLRPGRLSVFRATGPPGLPPDVALCGVEVAGGPPVRTAAAPVPALFPGLKQLELAVDTDHELFVLFDNAIAAATYLVQMYAEVSDIYMRDVDTRVELVFARIWGTPTDPFDGSNPLPEFRDHWDANMGSVERDVAQLLSGRRNYPFGGQAYLSTLCIENGYSVVGYALGFFPNPATPNPYTYDIAVTAHELGHNSGALHTHNEGIDSCHDPATSPQRGTIMSYCAQTWSGGNSNRDLYFHRLGIQPSMREHIGESECVVADCNSNNIADDEDIATGTSPDLNGSGVPDECEDCNGNDVLDSTDILMGTSQDLNGNSVPDECEPDCNSNDFPDEMDIAGMISPDLHGNDIPDECEADCDGDGTPDFNELQSDMSLDVDRNTVLDACEDCDGDGTIDLEALAGAHGVWVASGLQDSSLREFHGTTGVLTDVSSGGGGAPIHAGQGLIVTADSRVLVTDGDDRVAQFDLEGHYVSDLVPPGSGGLSAPAGLVLTNSILAFDPIGGASLGEFVAAGSGGLSSPFGLVFGRDGDLYATSGTHEVLQFDGRDGSFVGTFVSFAANGGLLDARGLTFKPDGNLLVASLGTDEVLEFDGKTGAPLGKWAQVGTGSVLTQDSPWDVRVGPNGNVFVVRTGDEFSSTDDDTHYHDNHLHLSNSQIYEYDARNGNFLRTYIGGNDHGLVFPTAFDFVPGWEIDCNLNQQPDGCDISLGGSADDDGNGVPDECEVDCNGNGTLDRLDVIPYGTGLDCNGNLSPDACDLGDGISRDCNANGRPDECEEPGCPSCNTPRQCDDGIVCTSDACNLLLGQCEAPVDPGSCLIDGVCLLEGAPNPMDACESCDPAAPFDWSTIVPPEITGLVLSQPEVTRLAWDGQGPGVVYDLTGGSISELRATGGVASAGCLEHDVGGATWDDTRPEPPVGDGYYYLARPRTDCASGSYGSDSAGRERQPIAACP